MAKHKIPFPVGSTQEAPCYGCGEREVLCHSKCQRYLEYKARTEEERHARNRDLEYETARFQQIHKFLDQKAKEKTRKKNRRSFET